MSARIQPSLSVVYPMYNEEDCAEEVLSETAGFLSEHFPDYEIIAVNDGSTDATGAILDRVAAKNPRIKVIHHARNRTLGGALKSGFGMASKELVLYSDADFPWDLHELPRAVRAITRADIVSAYRHDRHSEGLRRTIQSYVYNSMVNLLFGLYLRDVNFSCKLMRADVLRRLGLKSEGSFIDAELLIRALRQGYRVVQIGIDYFPRTRGVSTLTRLPVVLQILGEMAELFWELRRLRPAKPERALGGSAPTAPSERNPSGS